MHSTKICVITIATFLLFGSVNSQSGTWQSYVDDNLLAGGFVEGAIIGRNGGYLWAASPNFNPTENERQTLINRFNGSYGQFDLNGQKYLVIKSDDRSIYGKRGAGGAICVRTTTAIIIGIYNEQLQPGVAATIVEKFADYLLDNGY
ncbi:hypothetical protein HA402_005389 [Bradysia odoriphaga]|nr:hypothetical protein HA402_005389 [Bradysia odoriphaga]